MGPSCVPASTALGVEEVLGTRSTCAARVSEGFFLDFELKRDGLARYGPSVDDANAMVLTVVGGEEQAVEGQEQHGIIVRYARDTARTSPRCDGCFSPSPGAARSRWRRSPRWASCREERI